MRVSDESGGRRDVRVSHRAAERRTLFRILYCILLNAKVRLTSPFSKRQDVRPPHHALSTEPSTG